MQETLETYILLDAFREDTKLSSHLFKPFKKQQATKTSDHGAYFNLL